MLRISLTGPESTGKTTLAAQLAAHYGTSFAPEFAREYLADSGPRYTLEDLEEIARGQLQAEAAAEARAHRLVFSDTDLLVIKIWAEHSFGTCPEWILRCIDQQQYDLVLLMGVDLPWQPDPLREHPHLRQQFYDLYQRELRERMSNFAEISGDGPRRFAQACFLVDELLRSAEQQPLSLQQPVMPNTSARYTLENSTCRASFAAHGAELTSLVTRADNLEYVWPGDPAVWARHAPVLFPLVGRLPDDVYHYEGRDYKLPQHGFARDQEFAVLRHDATELVFRLQHDETTQAIFPFAFELTITYTLREAQLTVRWDVRNPAANQPLLFSIGGHPAVRCPLLPGEAFEDYYFEFDHPVTLERHLLRGGLLTGATAPVLNHAQELPLSYELFADDALVFKHYDFTNLTLRTRKSAHFVRFRFDGFPYLGLWTKGPGAGFVCVEPWHGVASPTGEPGELRDKEGIMTLEPGQVFTAAFSIEVG
ncbi:aldose epimerase family protein [Hymenobacter properus]|uniref:AAA family ATPase n=1 Tax=Hymenobacter properus TaxID=2791026 RepID=A0A931BGT7_9BACT|nr:AAA family ATPase [Hymenobacter properus]MBF9141371.1 AAA family ATPase [Hymenobacter properus]MBR7720180.1 AAA family ATPase [Microvirga sp. SRT04]